MKWPPLLLLLCALVGSLAACGQEVTGRAATPHDVSTTTTPRSAPSARASDRFIARAALLRLSDLPTGWTVKPSDDSDDAHCPATDRVERNSKAESDDFSLPHVHSLAQEVVVLRSAAAANAAIDVLIAHSTLACIARQIDTATRRSVRPGIRIGRMTIEPLPTAAAGDRSEAARLTIPVSAGGVSTHVYGDFAFARVGRGLSIVALLSERLPADGLRTQIVARAVERLAAALARGKT